MVGKKSRFLPNQMSTTLHRNWSSISVENRCQNLLIPEFCTQISAMNNSVQFCILAAVFQVNLTNNFFSYNYFYFSNSYLWPNKNLYVFSDRYIRARNFLLTRVVTKSAVANYYRLPMVVFLSGPCLKILRSATLLAFWHHGLNI